MNELVERTRAQVPGFVFGLSVGGEREVFAFGDRQVRDGHVPLPMEVQTSFDIGSITKILATTAGFMRLIDRGEVSLDDQVCRYLSEWLGTEKAEITIRDLFLHRSGLWEWRPLYIHSEDPVEALLQIASIPLRYSRNVARHYSDFGFIALGQIMVKITGAGMEAAVNDLVLQPLHLENTRFASPTSLKSVAATSFGDAIEKEMVASKIPYPVPENANDFNGWRERILVGEVNDGNAFHVFSGVSSHAGLFSNTEDLLTFGELMIASAKGEGPYSKGIIEEFLTTGPDAGQQLGFRSWTHTVDGCTTEYFGHTGFPGTALAFSPSHDCVAVLMTNRLHAQGVPVSTELLLQPFINFAHQKLHSA